MTGRQDDRKEYDRTKDRQRILDEYMIEDMLNFTCGKEASLEITAVSWRLRVRLL